MTSNTLRDDVSLWNDTSIINESDYRQSVSVDDCLSVIQSQNPPGVCSSVLEMEGPMSNSLNYPLHSTLHDVSVEPIPSARFQTQDNPHSSRTHQKQLSDIPNSLPTSQSTPTYIYQLQKRPRTIGENIVHHCLPLNTSDCFTNTSDVFFYRKSVTSSIKRGHVKSMKSEFRKTFQRLKKNIRYHQHFLEMRVHPMN